MNNNVFLSNAAKPRFGRKAESVRLLSSSINEFHNFMDTRGQAFLEEADAWLTDHEANDNAEQSDLVRLGVGMFAIEDRLRKEKDQ